MKINTLPQEHAANAWLLAPRQYQKALTLAAASSGVHPQKIHEAILQGMYNVHLRALEHLQTRLHQPAALPIVAPHGKVASTAVVRKAEDLPRDAITVRSLLRVIEAEKATAKTGRIESMFLNMTGRGRSIIAVHSQRVGQALNDIIQGKKPSKLISLIARETFLGFGISTEDQKTHSFSGDQSISAQVKRENRLGAKRFESEFPTTMEKHWREDFAPLIEILARIKRR